MKKLALLSTVIAAALASPAVAQQISTDQQTLTQERAAAEEGAPLYVSPSVVRIVKQALNQYGYDVGNVDGNWNQQTQNSVANFQQANGLEPTGNLNLRLLSALGVGITGGGGMAQGAQAYGGNQTAFGQQFAPSVQGGFQGGQQGSSQQRFQQQDFGQQGFGQQSFGQQGQ